jgi:rubredoxin
MKAVGRCVQCGTDIVQQARTWCFAKMSERQDATGALAQSFLWAEAPIEAARQAAGGAPLADDFRCPQCGVIYPKDVWADLAAALSMVSGMAMMPTVRIGGTSDSQQAAKLTRYCEALYKKLKVCDRCKMVYKGGFFKGCPGC